MSEHIYALLLVFLEMTFIFIVLALLFQQRRRLGDSPYLLVLGMLMVIANLVVTADIQGALTGSLTFSVGKVVMFLPLLLGYLMLYIVSGPLPAQRLIIGTAVIYGLLYYIGRLTQLQCNWLGFSLSSDLNGSALDLLLNSNRHQMNMTVLLFFFNLFWIPIVYTKAFLLKIPRLFCIWGALISAQLINILPGALLRFGSGGRLNFIDGDFIAAVIGNLWLGTLLAVYLKLMENENTFPRKSPLDLVFSFFGSYGRSMQLEKHLREWENRYQLVLENSNECIILANSKRRVIDVNRAARKLLGRNRELLGNDLFAGMSEFEPSLPEKLSFDQAYHFRCNAQVAGTEPAVLLCSLSRIRLRDENMFVLLGRDVTAETRLSREREKLAEQLIHSQRLESLGILAGGIAHDFNNFIHAIMGHVDVAMMTFERETQPKLADHLDKVIMIAEKAGKLTSQLLGFARRGKYNATAIDIGSLINNSLSLIGPPKLREVQVEVHAPEGKWQVSADQVQLQQVLVNMIINALYAMENNTGVKQLKLCCDSAENFLYPYTLPPNHPPVKLPDYLRIIIADNGCGMDKATRQKIFEPFFTTKPVGVGTGMGLAMVYGTITNHGGWINVDSNPGAGTRFQIFLPKLQPKSSENSPS